MRRSLRRPSRRTSGSYPVNFSVQLHLGSHHFSDHRSHARTYSHITQNRLSLRRQVNSPAALLQQYKPLHERTYEQQRLVDEYLMMHYGETVTGKYKDNASSNSSSASSSSSSSKCTIDLGTENPLLEAVDFGNFTLFDADARKSVSPSALFPYFALDFPARVARVALHFWNQTNQGAAGAERRRAVKDTNVFFALTLNAPVPFSLKFFPVSVWVFHLPMQLPREAPRRRRCAHSTSAAQSVARPSSSPRAASTRYARNCAVTRGSGRKERNLRNV